MKAIHSSNGDPCGPVNLESFYFREQMRENTLENQFIHFKKILFIATLSTSIFILMKLMAIFFNSAIPNRMILT